jgi:hypothetical protein
LQANWTDRNRELWRGALSHWIGVGKDFDRKMAMEAFSRQSRRECSSSVAGYRLRVLLDAGMVSVGAGEESWRVVR